MAIDEAKQTRPTDAQIVAAQTLLKMARKGQISEPPDDVKELATVAPSWEVRRTTDWHPTSTQIRAAQMLMKMARKGQISDPPDYIKEIAEAASRDHAK